MAKAKDIVGCESDWAVFKVVVQKNKVTDNSFFLNFLESYPLLMRLLTLLK